MCDDPPQRKNRIVDLAGFRRPGTGAASAPNAARPKLSPASADVDADKNARRLRPEENSGGFIIAQSDADGAGNHRREIWGGGQGGAGVR
ncbi:hypothetical protein LBMAG56_24890 [Verrucomicrobiota bacterium]|nr:hypothetical protein LBMAG56_24890 [Verrucomicrobiota bacterium]